MRGAREESVVFGPGATNKASLAADERALVAALRRGSKVAFVNLLQREAGSVRAALARYLDRYCDIDDIAQEVFLCAFRNIEHFEERASLRTWLLGIARNRALTFRRDEGRRRAREDDAARETLNDWEIERLATVGSDERGSALKRLGDCVKLLGDRQRVLVERFYFRGESAEAIAQDNGRTGAAVRMSLLRVRGVLRNCVEQGEAERGEAERRDGEQDFK